MTETEKLKESMHSLVTPEFTGTHDEMIQAAGYWITLITQVRNLLNAVQGFDNRAAIINQLDKEVGIMKAELENLSAKMTPGNGLPTMAQPAPTDSPDVQIEPEVDMSAKHEEDLQRMRANAGVQSNIKVHPLSRVTY